MVLVTNARIVENFSSASGVLKMLQLYMTRITSSTLLKRAMWMEIEEEKSSRRRMMGGQDRAW
jgi:hypothetical protein